MKNYILNLSFLISLSLSSPARAQLEKFAAGLSFSSGIDYNTTYDAKKKTGLVEFHQTY